MLALWSLMAALVVTPAFAADDRKPVTRSNPVPQTLITRAELVPQDHVLQAYPANSFNDGWAKHLTKHEAQIQSWNDKQPDLIPLYCYDNAKGADLSPYDVEVYDFKYDDCDSRWTMCRHKDAEWSIEDLGHRFGLLPVWARGLVANVLLLPLPGGTAASTNGGGLQLKGDVDLGSLFHEVGHSVDTNCPFPGRTDTQENSHDTEEWMDAFHKDGWVPSPLANGGLGDDFAEVYLHALYDVNVPGGLASLGTQSSGKNNWDLIKNQLDLVKRYCKAALSAGSGDKCENKRESTEIIKKDGSRLQGGSRKLGPKRMPASSQ
ncbi:hypothetical protein A1Q2_00123 [Trichosporon asahii var. asahii CBS 8904]|uniref:Conidiation-specific protein 13 n=1 Tax=Trichosporon asahii var. asahii (strain CBS 8904) TaxID=1220162 RepID=K1W1A1_TRIAC|nr:hypothetical protein A1Q2_00123 [Trichosporon asahii var. asahii CBS 8904]